MKSLIALLALVLLATAPVSALEKSSDYYSTQNETKSKMEFTVTFDEAKNTIRMYYPQINTDELLYEFIEERDIQRRIVDGSEMFFTGFESNLFYRDLDLVEQNPEWADHFTEAVRFVLSEYGRERQAGFAEFKQPWSAFFD
ncbi:MAG: transglutaminase domain-containing protein, partial [Mesotoga sp.]|nr:transglutaminase domain-containing protein [Mesotoga sp.]MDD5683099.1 transglutaminase domain-containing protein [Mesotoga sp.]